jgi:hypothetical protein
MRCEDNSQGLAPHIRFDLRLRVFESSLSSTFMRVYTEQRYPGGAPAAVGEAKPARSAHVQHFLAGRDSLLTTPIKWSSA